MSRLVQTLDVVLGMIAVFGVVVVGIVGAVIVDWIVESRSYLVNTVFVVGTGSICTVLLTFTQLWEVVEVRAGLGAFIGLALLLAWFGCFHARTYGQSRA